MPSFRTAVPNPAHLKVREFLLSLFRGGVVGAPPTLLTRLAAGVLREVSGGRLNDAEQAADLTQEFLVRVLSLRVTHPTAPFEDSSPGETVGWARATLRSLAVDSNPFWNTQRALRAVVNSAIAKPLPAPTGLPSALEAHSRFSQPLVAAACAQLVSNGRALDARTLTTSLMAEYQYGGSSVNDTEVARLQADSDADNQLAVREVVRVFLHEAGVEGQQLLARRALGFKRMAALYGVAVATVHQRYTRLVNLLRRIARRVGAGFDAVAEAVDTLISSVPKTQPVLRSL